MCAVNAGAWQIFLSTPSARRATPILDQRHRHQRISIHALREEGDSSKATIKRVQTHFYPRPPRGGRHGLPLIMVFSYTISIHALREEGDIPPCFFQTPFEISIHALREEGDAEHLQFFLTQTDFYPRPPRGGRPCGADLRPKGDVFLSTPSARRATHTSKPCSQTGAISIHALREEGDD